MKKRLIGLTIVLSLGLQGCISAPIVGAISSVKNLGGNTPQSSKAKKLAKDQRKTKQQGAVAGAVGGAVLGRMIGGTDGAVIGAGLGTVAGVALGKKIAKIKKSNVQAQDKLNQQITYLNASIRAAQGEVSTSQKTRKLLSIQIANSGNNIASRKVILSKLSSTISRKKSALKRQKSDLKKHKKLISSAKKQGRKEGSRINSRNNDNKVSVLSREVNKLEAELNKLSSMKVNFQARG